MEDQKEFYGKRASQKVLDKASGNLEKNGRSMVSVPDDFIFLTRVIGLLRGLTAELECSCPIMHILALNARVGMAKGVDEDDAPIAAEPSISASNTTNSIPPTPHVAGV